MKRFLGIVAGRLSEPVMGFLALTALMLAVVPLLFDLRTGVEKLFDALDWPIVGLFALEYVAKLSLASSKRAYLTDPWHVLDVFIILAPIAALLPGVSDTLRSSPVLRILRLVRVALLGARTGQVASRETKARRAPRVRGPFEVRVVLEEGELRSSNWEDLSTRLKDLSPEWFHVSGVRSGDVDRLGALLGVPASVLESKLAEAAYPRIDEVGGRSIIFAWHPEVKVAANGGFTLDRQGIVAVCLERTLVTLVGDRSDLPIEASRILPSVDTSMPHLVRVTFAILKAFLARYQLVVGRLEEEVRYLETLSAEESSPEFLRHGFRIRKDLAGVTNDLWHLSQAIAAIKEGRVQIRGLEKIHRAQFSALDDGAKYMHNQAENAKETLLSVIDLHMNAASFQMNKVMKLLTIVTTLTLVPTVVCSLLALNIEGGPLPIKLSHVSFGVGAGMALCLYVFAVKGWLR